MPGEKNLQRMLATLEPVLLDTEYVFCSLENASFGDQPELAPIAAFMESEGLTLVIPREEAERHQITFTATFRCITLQLHSSLEAVGLTAAVSSALAKHGISANIIAAFFHDHVFVPTARAGEALAVLIGLSDINADDQKNRR